jgi:hypothetical protein
MQWMKEVRGGSDRAAALASCAGLEGAIEEFLKSKLALSSNSKILSSAFRPGGLLDTVGRQLQILYLFGYLEKIDFELLTEAFSIRNRFAHDPLLQSFDDPVLVRMTSLMVARCHGHRLFDEMWEEQNDCSERGMTSPKARSQFETLVIEYMFDFERLIKMKNTS